MTRNLEDGSAAAANGSPSRNSVANNRLASTSTTPAKPSPPPEKNESKLSVSARLPNEKPSLAADHNESASLQAEHEAAATTIITTSAAEKLNVQVLEWPRIYIALSRKEKEDDFLAMKGTKLPQRPKKRAKHIDRTLQVYILIFLMSPSFHCLPLLYYFLFFIFRLISPSFVSLY